MTWSRCPPRCVPLTPLQRPTKPLPPFRAPSAVPLPLAPHPQWTHLQGWAQRPPPRTPSTAFGITLSWVQSHSGATSQPCDRQALVVTLRASVSSNGVSDPRRVCWGFKQEMKAPNVLGLRRSPGRGAPTQDKASAGQCRARTVKSNDSESPVHSWTWSLRAEWP